MAERSSELKKIDTTGIDATEDKTDVSLELRANDAALAATETRDDEATEQPSAETEQIREQIVETRRGMSETIDAIQEKLSLANISEQVQTQVSEQINNAVETAKDAVYGKAGDIVNTVGRSFKQIGRSDLAKKAQQNPTALALIGAGIGALLVGVLVDGGGKKKKKKSASYQYDTGGGQADDYNSMRYNTDDDDVRYTDSPRRGLTANEASLTSAPGAQTTHQRTGDKTDSAYETVSNAAGAAYETVSGAASSAYETLGGAAGKTYEGVGNLAGKTYEGVGSLAGKTYESLGSAASYTYEKAGNVGEQMKINYDHYIEENPLAVGAVALALGAVVGFAIPLTKKENELMGEYRDNVLEKAQASAQDAIGTVKNMATEAQKAITEEVKTKTA